MKKSAATTHTETHETRLCKDCKYCQKPDSATGEYLCIRPIGESPVTGGARMLKHPCEMERTIVAYGCGIAGRFFDIKEEEKKSFFERLKGMFKRS